MSDNTTEPPRALGSSAPEIELRRYEARLGLWKVVLGTMIVGLAGVLIPGLVSFYTTYFETLRKDAELKQAQQAAHQQYIKDFFDTAINQDIELRIRFANYFADLSGENQRTSWDDYYNSQLKLRKELREEINKIEEEMVHLSLDGKTEFKTAKEVVDYRELERRREWAYREIGYVPIESEAVGVSRRSKHALYQETIEIVARLAGQKAVFDPGAKDWARFWTLYNTELIGVESRDFARTMISIGSTLKRLAAANSLPDEELRKLSQDLAALAFQELAGLTKPAAQ